MVLQVRLEVLRQLADALAQDRDLYFRATRVSRVGAILVDEGLLLLSR